MQTIHMHSITNTTTTITVNYFLVLGPELIPYHTTLIIIIILILLLLGQHSTKCCHLASAHRVSACHTCTSVSQLQKALLSTALYPQYSRTRYLTGLLIRSKSRLGLIIRSNLYRLLQQVFIA